MYTRFTNLEQIYRAIPDDPGEKHKLLLRKRLEAFEGLCNVVYKEKGFSRDGIPFSETTEKQGQAIA